ncbi:MAG: hypothetical protein Ct9H300mP3_07940 [Gammaproteobacteria bacterium]|nr:MAG: hypothetical protein Ct9H300mP3_07940 [Gammaproteobacteria bacterium]
MLSQPLRSLSEGITRPRPIMYFNIGMLVMAVIGNYCFIYGNGGFFPKWEQKEQVCQR